MLHDKIITPAIFKILFGVTITQDMHGKMQGFWSVNTSANCNTECERRSKNPNYICADCYAKALLAFRTSQEICYTRNYEILTTRLFTFEELPVIYNPYLRFEAFGDVQNEIHVLNYLNIARKNPNVKCSLFTKNIALVNRVIAKFGKPSNLRIVYSICRKNVLASKYNLFAKLKKLFPCIDLIFIVVTSNFAIENNIVINCAKKCWGCFKCYEECNENVIYEILKQEGRKHEKRLAKSKVA